MVEIWAKIWDILPPCKKRGQDGSNICRYFMSIANGESRFVRLADGPILIYKFWQKNKERKKESTAAKYIGLPSQPPLDREAQKKYRSKIYRPTRPAAAGPGGLNKATLSNYSYTNLQIVNAKKTTEIGVCNKKCNHSRSKPH